jgi:hypothetical protein
VWRGWSGWVEAEFHADRVGDVGEVAGVNGDDWGLVTDGGGDQDRVDGIDRARGGAGYPGAPAEALVIRDDGTRLKDAGDLMLGAAAPGLGKHHDRHDRADAGCGELVVQSKESGLCRSAASSAPVS